MKTGLIPDSVRYRTMSTSELRESFLFDSLSSPGEMRMAYIDVDRAVIGMASPTVRTLRFPALLDCAPAIFSNAAK